MTEPLSKQYDPAAIEAELYEQWRDSGYFHADPDAVLRGERDPYVIVIPPPNVTAVLHMGHGLNNTLQDLLIRWKRMQGYEVLWLPGTDHAGIATQNVVERLLAKEGKTRQDVGREAFVERVWSFVEETGSTILQQLRAIGSSFDESRTRFTLDEGLSQAVREVFVRLYEDGLIYRGNYIINWCPRCHTALSNEEAEPEETEGRLYHLRYPLVAATPGALPTLPDGRPYLVVATTRPETMLGDTAVAVAPGDARYEALVGQRVELPLTGRTIPIVADEWADPEFGSGAVKVTPAHDPNDFEIGKRHGLEVLDVLTPEATMNENAPEAFRGLDRLEARARVMEALEAQGLVEKVEQHRHSVPHCYRCGTIVEPRLSLQWFVKMKPLAEPALEASRNGEVRFTPDRWTKVYEHWLENIRDWCISRQLWWGHRIPAWYCRADGCEEVVVAREAPERCPKCGGAELEQDADVLDTWFSSWLWPFSTMGWPDDTKDLAAFYPTQTLSTAPEILFFWVARMVMSGLRFMGEVPFTDVLLHATVRDHHNRKMSKSLGNGIDPLDVVERFGADALRYTVVAGAAIGTDFQLNYEDLAEAFAPGRNFANKLWNAGRFALMNLEGHHVRAVDDVGDDLEPADRWVLARLNTTIADVTRHLDAFRVHEAADAIHSFFWAEVADWYLEMLKPRLYDDAPEKSRDAARATLVEVLDGVFRLLHPIMPFVTEALWLRLPWPDGVEREESLVIARWPEPRPDREAPADVERMEVLMELIGTVRTLRGEYGVQAGRKIRIELAHVPDPLAEVLAVEGRAVQRLADVDAIEQADGATGRAGAHAVLRGGAELFVPLEGVIDVARERTRLADDIQRMEGLLNGTTRRLGNQDFVSKAPEDVVVREREKQANLEDQLERLRRKRQSLEPAGS
ncbi:MAG TPA: valine--tRNA ligase [Longimicrobiales bacterium]|nr:valine--tRNA ligase [Longimicrobiales bacterium]